MMGIDNGSQMMSQRAPTAGGQYHWVSILVPKSCRRFLSYLIGRVDPKLACHVTDTTEAG